MLSRLACCLAASLTFAGCLADDQSSVDQADNGDNGLSGAPEHVLKTKDAGHSGGGGSPLMTSHGGTIMVTNKTEAIFWGTWSPTDEIVTGMDSFFQGWGGSHMAQDSDEYTGTNGQVTSASAYLGHVFDASAAPKHALTTGSAVAEVCTVTGQNPDPNAVYFIYTSTGAGHVSYCAWHSYGACSNGALVQVAYMPNITGISGCDPQDPQRGNRAEGLEALANVTSHELSETITDPRNGGWWDNSGGENGDKCAWAFNGQETLSNGTKWYLQGEWSNAAYTAGTGLPNRSGQNGCLY